MKNTILFLFVCTLIFLYGCPNYGGDEPCPTYDTIRANIDSLNKKYLVHKGNEELVYVDILTGDTLTFKGNGMVHGFETTEIPVSSDPGNGCKQILISEYYSISYTNPLNPYETITFCVRPKNNGQYIRPTFTNYLYVLIPGASYEKATSSLCVNCIDRDSVKLDNRYFYDVYNVHLYGVTIEESICWNKHWGAINFPNGIIDNRLLIIHSIKK